jgi:prepilin-type N-terminal cleavage/methylation domain-containing protein
MKNRGFTLVEIFVTIVIVGILATIGLPVYQNILESSKEKVCDTNLFTLKKAVEIYTVEHDSVPGSLSQLNDKDIEKAYASVMSGKGAWQRKLAYLIVEGPQWGRAYAAAPQSFGMPHLRCPSNPDKSAAAVSYGLNSGIAGISAYAYKKLSSDTVVVADSDGVLFDYNSNGCPGPAAQPNPWGFPVISFSTIKTVRFHKHYQVLSQPDNYLKSVDMNGRIHKVTSGNCTEENVERNSWWSWW